jgi:predicted DNA-binding transcriptional regulator AlpA
MEFNMNENFRDKQAAQYLGVSTSTVWLYAKRGNLHPVRLSPRVTIFKKSDLDAFITSQVEAQAVAS